MVSRKLAENCNLKRSNEVAIELMNDLIEEQQSHFASRQEIFDLKRQLAVYEAKEQIVKGEQYVKSI